MSITIKPGDLLTATENIIAHQVNGLGIMGGGVAKQIKDVYPNVFRTYKTYTDNHPSPESLLGANLIVLVDGSKKKFIANLFGQAHIGYSQKQTETEALRKALLHLKGYAQQLNLSVAMPHGIGCGRGGGDWNEIYALIDSVFHDYPVTLYRDPSKR